jgi:hypothetical protein
MMASEPEYSQVPTTDYMLPYSLLASSNTQDRKSQIRSLRRNCLLAFICGLIVGIAAVYGLHSFLHTLSNTQTMRVEDDKFHNEIQQSHPNTKPHHNVNADLDFVINPNTGEAKCGNNWQEAKQLGCHFDVLASRWYSDDCYNGDLMETMLKEVDFQWFEDPYHTKPVSWAVARSGEFEALWPVKDFHIMHCLYLWRRLHSAVVEHRYLDDDVYSYGHTVHCTRLIMQWPKEWQYGKNTTTIATSGRPYCRNRPL